MGRADLHIHTTYSDGKLTPVQILEYFSRRNKEYQQKFGFNYRDIIAITDHNIIEGALEARAISSSQQAQSEKPEVIIGEEISTLEGHVLALNIQETIPPRKTLNYTLKAIKQQGGLAIAAHPYSSFWVRGWMGVRGAIRKFPFDAIEVTNSHLSEVFSNVYTRIVNRISRNLPEIAGSDAHFKSALDKVYTFFPGITSEDLIKAIKQKRTRAVARFWSAGEILEHIRDAIDLHFKS